VKLHGAKLGGHQDAGGGSVQVSLVGWGVTAFQERKEWGRVERKQTLVRG